MFLGARIPCEEHVAGLDIQVGNAVVVQVGQATRDVQPNVQTAAQQINTTLNHTSHFDHIIFPAEPCSTHPPRKLKENRQ